MFPSLSSSLGVIHILKLFHYVMIFSSYMLSYWLCVHLTYLLIIFHLSLSRVTCNIILSFLYLMKGHILILRNWLYFVRITPCLLFPCRYILALLMLLLVILCAETHYILPLWYGMSYLGYNQSQSYMKHLSTKFLLVHYILFSSLGFLLLYNLFLCCVYLIQNCICLQICG